MDTDLTRQQAIGMRTAEREGRALDPGLVALLVVKHLGLETLLFGPSEIHSEEHLRPILRLGSPRSGVNRDDGVLRVVLPAEELLDFRRLDLLLQLVQVALQVVRNGLPFFGPFNERPNLFLPVVEVLNEI